MKGMKNLIKKLSLLLLLVVFFTTCTEHYSPKPRGYFRIDLPVKKYRDFDTTFPYTFEYPLYAAISGDPYFPKEKYWINIQFPKFKATLHISYKTIHNNLSKYIEDAHLLVSKHIPKASAINDSVIIDPSEQLYGLVYDIEGNGAASPYQFFLTDSIHRFVRGALYFNVVPNNDSLEPVIGFIKKDVQHMIATFRWKNSGPSNE